MPWVLGSPPSAATTAAHAAAATAAHAAATTAAHAAAATAAHAATATATHAAATTATHAAATTATHAAATTATHTAAHAWPDACIGSNRGPRRGAKLASPGGVDGLADAPGSTDKHGYACGGEHLIGIGTAVTSDDSVYAHARHEFGGLDAGAAGRHDRSVLHRIESHALSVHNQQVLTPPKPRVHGGVQRRPGGGDSNLHDAPLYLFSLRQPWASGSGGLVALFYALVFSSSLIRRSIPSR
jgi:hypothetical protein